MLLSRSDEGGCFHAKTLSEVSMPKCNRHCRESWDDGTTLLSSTLLIVTRVEVARKVLFHRNALELVSRCIDPDRLPCI